MPPARTDRSRRHTVLAAEKRREMARRLEADLERNVERGAIGALEQLARPRKSAAHDVAEWRHPHGSRERAREMRRTQVGDVRHRRHIQIIGETTFHIVADAAEDVVGKALTPIAPHGRAGGMSNRVQHVPRELIRQQRGRGGAIGHIRPKVHDLLRERRIAERCLVSHLEASADIAGKILGNRSSESPRSARALQPRRRTRTNSPAARSASNRDRPRANAAAG